MLCIKITPYVRTSDGKLAISIFICIFRAILDKKNKNNDDTYLFNCINIWLVTPKMFEHLAYLPRVLIAFSWSL